MAKMYAINKIIRTNKDGQEEVIPARTVFECTPAEAKQFDGLKAARQATKEEITKADELAAAANGSLFGEEQPASTSTQVSLAADAPVVENDPKGLPKDSKRA